jgi:serine/threonine-protein kinase RsbW
VSSANLGRDHSAAVFEFGGVRTGSPGPTAELDRQEIRMYPDDQPTSWTATRLHHRGPASTALASQLRRELRTWAVAAGIPADTVGDLTLSSYEAMINTALHAYPADAVGILELDARLERESIVVTVSDQGHWTLPSTPEQITQGPRAPPGGRGLPLIHGLASHAEVSHGEQGTTVLMTWPRRGRK